MTKLIIQLIVLWFCLPLNAQPTLSSETLPTPIPNDDGKENWSVVNAGPMNSVYHDYCPLVFDGGILFTSDRVADGSGKSADANFYFAPMDAEGKIGLATLYDSAINSDFQEGMATISPNGKMIVFSRDIKELKQGNGFSDVRLYSATLKDGAWTDIKKMSINMTQYSSGHPAFSADGNKLYFVSNRPGSLGGMDIYVSKLEKGKWTKPENLGGQINSSKNEMFPFVDESGALYFSSNKNEGMGLLDVYKASPQGKDDWGQAVNLGAPINSKENDFGFYKNKNQNNGYFSSNRKGGQGGNDIYYWGLEKEAVANLSTSEAEKKCVLLKGQLKEEDGLDLDLEDVRVLVTQLGSENGEEVYTDEQGRFEICLECDQAFSVKVFPIGYYMNDEEVSTKDFDCSKDQQIEVEVEMTKIEVDEKIAQSPNMNDLAPELSAAEKAARNKKNKNFLESISVADEEEEDDEEEEEIPSRPDAKAESETKGAISIKKVDLPKIYYGFDRYQLDEPSKSQLNDLAVFLKENPGLDLSIKSYTDPKGRKAYNKWLSKRRAEEVMKYFVQTGVEEVRLKIEAKGELEESSDLTQVSDDAEKRRTEFELIDNNQTEDVEEDADLSTSVDAGEDLYLSNVYYAFDSYKLNDPSKSEVENVILRLLDNPELKVEIQSHTDSRGSATYNQWLSQKRANEVVRYMVSKGINKNRLTGIGLGESKLINRCADGVSCSKMEHMKNRRTEFIFD